MIWLHGFVDLSEFGNGSDFDSFVKGERYSLQSLYIFNEMECHDVI